MNGKTKLELTWIGKEDQPRLEPRILIEQPEHSVPATDGTPDNMLIHGDNLLALKALEGRIAGTVKCIYIDPPYNTGVDFEMFEDGVEHSRWLSLMRDRLLLLRKLLAEDGSIWINIDDNEGHYLKVICDELFGRSNFITTVIWQKVISVKNSARHFSVDHDYILVYANNAEIWRPNAVAASDKQRDAYKNPDNDPRGFWQSVSLSARNYYSKGTYSIKTPSGRVIAGPPAGSYWRFSEEKFWELDRDRRIYWGRGGSGMPRRKVFLSEQGDLVKVPQTLWTHDQVGHTQDAKKESLSLFGADPFPTPKPEKLVARIMEIATKQGDLVLDSFAGSGTTGAVAHKMGRRWIMVEHGEHAVTHVVPRLRKVVEGTDVAGMTEALDWKGGGGFRFLRLAPSMLERDRWGNWVVSKGYNPAMLAEAMCRHMGFTYAPSQDPVEYWKHGYSTERDFIYVTTQAVTHTMLAALSNEVGPDRHLLVCCKAFSGKADAFDNLTIRKIPNAVLANCEWGRDDYSLKIATSPEAPITEAAGEEPEGRARRTTRRARASVTGEPGLFDVTSSAAEG